MKTLADFKRLAQKGAIFTAFWPCHYYNKRETTKTRTVTGVQTNATIFGTEKSYFYHPKTDRLSFIDGVMVEWSDPAKHGMPPECRTPMLAYAYGDTFPEHVKAELVAAYDKGRQAEKVEYDNRRKVIVASLEKDRDMAKARGDSDLAEYLQGRIDFIHRDTAKREGVTP